MFAVQEGPDGPEDSWTQHASAYFPSVPVAGFFLSAEKRSRTVSRTSWTFPALELRISSPLAGAAATHPWLRAVCVNALVRICAGGDQQWSSLPRQ